MDMRLPSSSRRSASSKASSISKAPSYVVAGTGPTGYTGYLTPGAKVSQRDFSSELKGPDFSKYALDGDYTHQTYGDYIRPFSAASSPSSSASGPGSPPPQTVTFTTCPQCNTVEHHFIQSSRTCGRCGHKRFFSTETSSMQRVPAGRTYWRPTRYTSSIVYAHVREGLEDREEAVHQMLATWSSFQQNYILSVATQVAQYASDASLQACYLELSNATGAGPNFTGAPMLSVANQGMCALATLEADDLLGTFAVLRQEHVGSCGRGGRGIVIVVLTYQGARLAVACRLDTGTL